MMSSWYDGDREVVSTKVIPVRRELCCPKCKQGKMVANGTSWPTSPVGYHHTCTACNETLVIRGIAYPFIDYVSDHE